LSPFLFIVILNVISEKIDEKTPWAMLFADDIVICGKEGGRVEERLETWRGYLEESGLKVSRKKTEHLQPKKSTTRIRMKRYGQEDYTELPTTNKFKYLGTVIDQDGGCEAEVTRRISAAWDKWRDLSGAMCDKKVPKQLKVLLYKTIIKPTLIYGNETWPITLRQEQRIEATEM